MKKVGRILERYDESFLEFIKSCEPVHYDEEGKGVVDKLVNELPIAFKDYRVNEGKVRRFDKKAQLLYSMLYGRTKDSNIKS